MLRFYANVEVLHDGVTGSCIKVTIYFPEDGKKIVFLVDCGFFQENGYDNRNWEKIKELEDIDFVLVTHAHIDHIGRIPYLVKQGYNKKIYCTEVTKALSRIALNNAVKINYINSGMNYSKMLYHSTDVSKSLKQMETEGYRESFYPAPNIEVTFYENGHIPGAASILVKISDPLAERPIVFFFSGDYKKDNIFNKTPDLPAEVLNEYVNIIIESTYGSTKTEDIEEVFESDYLLLLLEGKSVILPTISNYRLQERMYYHKKLVERFPILAGVKTYHEAILSREFNSVYKSKGYGFDADATNFDPVNITYIDKKTRPRVFRDKKQKVIFTSSGDGTHGAAAAYVYHYLSDPNVCVYFTSHQFENSVGERCLNTKKGEIADLGCGRFVKKNAEVRISKEFSGHAKQNELEELIKSFTNRQSVMINHGERSVQEAFKTKIEEKKLVKRAELMESKKGIKVDQWGIVKTFEKN